MDDIERELVRQFIGLSVAVGFGFLVMEKFRDGLTVCNMSSNCQVVNLVGVIVYALIEKAFILLLVGLFVLSSLVLLVLLFWF